MNLEWSKTANADLEKIAAFISETSKVNDLKFLNNIFLSVSTLKDNPRLGTKVKEFDDDSIRQVLFKNIELFI